LKVLDNLGHHNHFDITNGLLYTQNHAGEAVLYILNEFFCKQHLTEVIIMQAHKVLRHLGPQKSVNYVRRHYWWPYIG
jgi:hypothetical protein